MKRILGLIGLLVLPAFSYAQESDTVLVVCNRATGEVTSTDSSQSAQRLPPCSTFKIYNTLIGLELGLLKGPDEPWYKWDGVRREFDSWNRDLTLREAFQASCVPAFQALARQIGPERMKEYIEKIGYGNKDISSGIDVFWLPKAGRTSILISADEQVALLNKLLDGKLPFSKKNVTILQDVMRVSKTENGTLYGKTGTGTDTEGKKLGWFVGFIESKGTVYTFACNMVGGDNASGKAARAKVEEYFQRR